MIYSLDTYRSRMKVVFIEVMKYAPIVSAAAFFIHYILGFFGIRTILTDLTIDLSLAPFLFAFAASVVFGFCVLHRLFILYSFLCSLDIDLHRWDYDLLDQQSELIWPIVFILAGCILFSALAKMYVKHRRERKSL